MTYYRITHGYLSNGKPMIADFRDLATAKAVAEKIFQRTGIIVAIEEVEE